MNSTGNTNLFSKDAKFLLALHSSTANLGIGLIQIKNSKITFRSSTKKVGKDLSNYLFNYVEEVLPSGFWPQIERLAVAIGPGGFTGTRLTVTLARTLAQQLQCQVDGISSFELMAHRISKELIDQKSTKLFWITQELQRRGVIAGKYELLQNNNDPNKIKIKELKAPYLLPSKTTVTPAIEFSEDVSKDIKMLLNISLESHLHKKKSLWQDVLPIYPTSPVNDIK